MYKNIIFLLFATLAYSLPHSYGETLPCGPTPMTYDFLGSSFTVQTELEGNFTLSLFATLGANFESDSIRALALSVSLDVGFIVTIQPRKNVILQATLVTPSLSITSALLLEGNFTAGCLQYDPLEMTYNQIDIESYNFTTQQLTIDFPAVGVYVLIAFEADSYLPAWYETNHTIPANHTKRLQYPEGLTVEIHSRDENVLSVSYNSSNPTQVTPSGGVISHFWEFKSHTEENINATLTYFYNKTQAELAKINVTELRWEFYNEVSNLWETIEAGASVDANAGAVIQITPHFSQWTVSQAQGGATSTSGSTMSGTSSTATGSVSAGSTTESMDSYAGSIQVNVLLVLIVALVNML